MHRVLLPALFLTATFTSMNLSYVDGAFHFSIGLSPQGLLAQEEILPDDGYYEDEPEMYDEDMEPPPPPPPAEMEAPSFERPKPSFERSKPSLPANRNPRFPVKSGGASGGSGGGQATLGQSGEIEFHLVNPPKFWKPKKRNIPAQYRK